MYGFLHTGQRRPFWLFLIFVSQVSQITTWLHGCNSILEVLLKHTLQVNCSSNNFFSFSTDFILLLYSNICFSCCLIINVLFLSLFSKSVIFTSKSCIFFSLKSKRFISISLSYVTKYSLFSFKLKRLPNCVTVQIPPSSQWQFLTLFNWYSKRCYYQ